MRNQQTYRVRTYEQLWDALQRFIRREVVMSIPVDMERDADMILADGIHELRALRAKVAEQDIAIAGHRPGNVRSITHQTAPTHTIEGERVQPFRPCELCGESDGEFQTVTNPRGQKVYVCHRHGLHEV